MQELNQIKGEFNLKQQRYVLAHSGFRILTGYELTRTSLAGVRSQQSAPALLLSPQRTPSLSTSLAVQPDSVVQPMTDTMTSSASHAAETTDLNSPRQRLQVAEMVMRKLFRKTVQTEERAAALTAENVALVEQVRRLQEAAALSFSASPPPSNQCPVSSSPRPPPLERPPTVATVTRIDAQQLEHLRHLAAEQDATIGALKLRIEELSTQHLERPNPTTTTRHSVVNRLQSKLQAAKSEAERQRRNYATMKRDFETLLGLKTKTLVASPSTAPLAASACTLLQLQERQLAQLAAEHAESVALYNAQLYDVEQQTCASYAQQRLLEQAAEQAALHAQQRDDVDAQIERCLVGVLERLRQVESENVRLAARREQPSGRRGQPVT